MSSTTYGIEVAKSSRSKCKKCKEPITKGDMRLVTTVENPDSYDLTSYHHVQCFRLPRKFATGSGKISIEDFVMEYIEDKTDDGSILPAKEGKIIKWMEEAADAAVAAGAKRKKINAAGSDDSLMGRIKAAAEAAEDGPNKKKVKVEKKSKDKKFDKMVEAYLNHHKSKSDALKDFLRWNRQVLQGNKEFVLFKVLDGEVYGRLGMCGICGGKLKFQEGDFDHVYCMGRFDEDTNMRIPCSFKGDRTDSKIPRYHPWYADEPTEEEKEEMDKIIEEAREGGGSGGDEADGSGSNPVLKELLEEADGMKWNLSDNKGLKAALLELVKIVEGKLDFPAGKKINSQVGPFLTANRGSTPKEIVQKIVKKYGFKEEKKKVAAAKEAAAETICANPKNAPLLLAFQELASLYFKGGNRNAGSAYTKVSNALKDLELEVTAENAMSLSKGKTKVKNIGKSSAEKMKEFMETGTMEKLEEKRADNA